MIRSLLILTVALLMTACATTSGTALQPPTPAQVQAACNFDAGIRPVVTVAMAAHATPAVIASVNVARVTIDAVCADPAKPLDVAAWQAFTAATNTVATEYARLKAQ